MSTKSILICGVGGQGILLASDIVAKVAMKAGKDVKKSEVHGMSQRGGNVVSSIRYGEKVYSPIVGDGMVDIILAFEKLEALRNIHLLRDDGKVIVNDYSLDPLPVASGIMEYPEDIFERIKKRVKAPVILNAVDIANEVGNIRTTNIVLLGVLASMMEFPKDIWKEVIKERVPPKTIDINIKAFERGYALQTKEDR